MNRKRSASGWHAASLAAALFAITLNFLQPLAHAALMRGDGTITSPSWKSMCLPSSQGEQDTAPQASERHECCLGLVHAPSMPLAPAWFVVVQGIITAVDRPTMAIDALQPVGIRDGPSQPHGPPPIV